MKKMPSLVVEIFSMKDIDKITEKTKYINIDITNIDFEIIDFFLKNGENYLYSEIIDGVPGYIYVNYEDFFRAEEIIKGIYAGMPNDLSKLEMARYLYVSIANYVFFDINLVPEKNENYNFSLFSSIHNLWGSLSLGRVNDISVSKIYYYLCRRLDIDIELEVNYDTKEAYNKLKINNIIFLVDLFNDIPFIQVRMKTTHFGNYNDDINLDKKVKYIKSKYNDILLDKALKRIDYTDKDCVANILYKTQNVLEVDKVKPIELSVIYDIIFKRYCPNYSIKINNLFLNNKYKNHFIIISYGDEHYSYNYKKKMFVKVNDRDIIANIDAGKIGLYLNEFIPNLM